VTPHGGHLRPIGGWWRRPAGVRVLKETEQRLRNRYGCGPESERGPDCRRAQGVCCSWRTNECVAYALAAVLSASAHGLEVERPAGFSSTVLEKAEEFRRRRTARLLAGRAGLA